MHSLAQHLQSQGRGNDSMLVHMTPREVGGLQALAQAHGGTLTRNPTTGLPEAGFLEDILPTIAGLALSFVPGVGPLLAAGLVGGGTALATGDLGKGLMAGLGAFGGAGLGSALSGIGASTAAAAQTAAAGAADLAPVVSTGMNPAMAALSGTSGAAAAQTAAAGAAGLAPVASTGMNPALATLTGQTSPTFANFSAGLGQLGTKQGLAALGDSLSTTQLAGIGLPLLGAMEPSGGTAAPDNKDKPTVSLSPPQPLNRQVSFPTFDYKTPGQRSSAEYQYFTPVGNTPSTITRLNELDPTITLARGGNVNLEDGSFVVDARTVSELGNGSSGAGQELLARMGGRPIRGPGDGVSDSIRANIGGKQEARVARDEVKFSPDAVKRMGGGSAEKGAQRLYALMHKAQQARKKAKRGEDTNLRGLVALRNAT